MGKLVNREEELKSKFNDIIKKVLDSKIGDDVDANFYESISFEGLVELKKAISQINNIITLKVTNYFISKLQEGGVVTSDQEKEMKQEVNKISANANGYDIRYEAKKILAEVKCNIPVNGNTFGAKQKKGIEDDINGLLDAGSKTKGGVGNTTGYFKFMVFLNAPGVPESVREILSKDKYKDKFDYYTKDDGTVIKKEDMRKDIVYIVFISEK